MRFWTEDPLMRYSLLWEYTERCQKALDEAGIEIPFPHRQIFVSKRPVKQIRMWLPEH